MFFLYTVGDEKTFFDNYPQQVAGHVALFVFQFCPPPIGLAVVLSSQNGDGVALTERQLVLVLSFIIPQSVHCPLVHNTQLLLNTCNNRVQNRQCRNFNGQFHVQSNALLFLTIQKLGALDVAFFHFFTLVCCRLHVTNGTGKDGCARLHQQLAEMNAVTGGGAVKRRPGKENRVKNVAENSNVRDLTSFVIPDPTRTHHPSLSAAFTFTPKSSRNLTMW